MRKPNKHPTSTHQLPHTTQISIMTSNDDDSGDSPSSKAEVAGPQSAMDPGEGISDTDESNVRAAAVMKLAKAVFHPIRHTKRTYTKSNDLERLRITRKYLAFSTGKPGSDSKYEQFLEPIDPDTMDEWLREANGPLEDLSPNGPDDLVHDNQLEAAFFCRQIIRHLDESHDADGYGPSVLNVRTFWTEEKQAFSSHPWYAHSRVANFVKAIRMITFGGAANATTTGSPSPCSAGVPRVITVCWAMVPIPMCLTPSASSPTRHP